MVFVFTNCRKNAFRIELKLNPSSAAVFCASSLTFGSVLIKIVAVFIVLRSIANIYPLSRKHTKIKVLQPDAVPIIQGCRYLGNVEKRWLSTCGSDDKSCSGSFSCRSGCEEAR